MKTAVEKRKPGGIADYVALAITTFGVGYIPGAPGTYGSIVAIGIYYVLRNYLVDYSTDQPFVVAIFGFVNAYIVLGIVFIILVMAGVWASSRSVHLLGNEDPSEAVVDEVMGQFLTLFFVPLYVSFWFVAAGFLLFRFFDIIKPFPANDLQKLKGGWGICADDLAAGLYAGACLSIIYIISLAI